jgi:nucleoside-diphosphate-sugar epimerase
VKASLPDYGHLDALVPAADVFVHFAWGGTKQANRNDEQVHHDNVRYTLDAMEAAHRMGCKVFVDAGSQAEYGTILTPITEETPCHPFSEYGKAKLAVYQQGTNLCSRLGMKYVHLRIFSLYGENDHPNTLVMGSLRKMLHDEATPLSSCTQMWNFLYVKDAAQLIHRLVESVMADEAYRTDVFNVASTDTRVLKDFVERMHVLSQSRSELLYGHVVPSNVVSLNPDMTKTLQRVGGMTFHAFDEVVEKIISKLKTEF